MIGYLLTSTDGEVCAPQAKNCDITLPIDWLCGQEFTNDQETQLVTQEQGIPDGWEGMDCGPASMKLFADKVRSGTTSSPFSPVVPRRFSGAVKRA